MKNDRISKRACEGECAGSCLVGKLWKRWIDTVKKGLRKRGLDIRQARRMVVVCEGEYMEHIPRDGFLTFTRCYSNMKPLSVESLSVAKPTT